ncbi:MAG TPA: RNA polymerase sigma factor [Chthoniobacteraceae bacterium]|jgi:RNA polymerase sigma factor (sigma-70 family)
MNSAVQSVAGNATDPELLEACLQGNRDAFGLLVSRYQGILCAQAYAICGDFGRSEDVAQEAFVSAWRQLRDLRDHAKFKSWLCGIARHLALRVAERRERDQPRSDAEDFARDESTPHQAAMSREEEVLVWQSLEQLPEIYRTVLTLFYREGQSIAVVAEALDLSEDAVKQRLSRGRAMLRQQVSVLVENTLQRTRPGPAFTLAVLAVVAATAQQSAAAATLLAAVKTSAPAKAAFVLAPFVAFSGGLVGLLGAWFGMKSAAESAMYVREREALRRCTRRVLAGVAVYLVAQIAVVLLMVRAVSHDQQFGTRSFFTAHHAAIPLSVIGLLAVYSVWLVRELLRAKREIQRIRAEERVAGTPIYQPKGAWRYFTVRGPAEYRSRWSFLGFPLVHVLWNDPVSLGAGMRPARGWVAIGDKPIGLVALGGIARGGIAIGGVAFGGIAFGGVSLGAVSIGGLAVAIWAYGGMAIGWIAQGGLALAWRVAMGGCAFSNGVASGGYASAPIANSPAAEALALQSAWLRATSSQWLALLIPLVVVVFVVAMGVIAMRCRNDSKAR